jgi:hypothetical protein
MVPWSIAIEEIATLSNFSSVIGTTRNTAAYVSDAPRTEAIQFFPWCDRVADIVHANLSRRDEQVHKSSRSPGSTS